MFFFFFINVAMSFSILQFLYTFLSPSFFLSPPQSFLPSPPLTAPLLKCVKEGELGRMRIQSVNATKKIRWMPAYPDNKAMCILKRCCVFFQNASVVGALHHLQWQRWPSWCTNNRRLQLHFSCEFWIIQHYLLRQRMNSCAQSNNIQVIVVFAYSL